MNINEKYIKRCLTLAKRGKGKVSPNPLVGAVIVKNDHVISEGYHHYFGGDHAERDAIKKSDPDSLKGSTIYINLEPCSHYGKTPPCSVLIRDSRIKKVVYSIHDPNPLTKNKADKLFKDSGISVETGVLSKEAFLLNRAFFTNIINKRAFITLKLASTLDGRISDFSYNSRWISGPDSMKIVHNLRYECDAIMGGINTVLYDNPLFTVRHPRKKKKIYRIILDSNCRIPIESNIVRTAKENPVIVICKKCEKQKHILLKKHGVTVWKDLDKGLHHILKRLYSELSIGHIFCEGGGKIAGSLIKNHLADEIIMFFAPKILGDKAIPSFFLGNEIPISKAFKYSLDSIKKVGEDVMIKYYSKELICLQDS